MFNYLKNLLTRSKGIFKPKRIVVKTLLNNVSVPTDTLIEVQYKPLSRELLIREVSECPN